MIKNLIYKYRKYIIIIFLNTSANFLHIYFSADLVAKVFGDIFSVFIFTLAFNLLILWGANMMIRTDITKRRDYFLQAISIFFSYGVIMVFVAMAIFSGEM